MRDYDESEQDDSSGDDLPESFIVNSGTDINGFTINVWRRGHNSISYCFNKTIDRSENRKYQSHWWEMNLGEEYALQVFNDLLQGIEPHPNYRYGRSFSYDLNPNHYRE